MQVFHEQHTVWFKPPYRTNISDGTFFYIFRPVNIDRLQHLKTCWLSLDLQVC